MTPKDELAEVSVLVSNWGTPELTVRCVKALLADGVPPERVVIVDNGSRDGSHAVLSRELPECGLIELEENIGFPRAINVAARALPGRHYLIMNNDAFVHRPGSVTVLLAAMRDPGVGIVAPKLLNEDLTLQRTVRPLDYPSAVLVRATGLSRFLPNRWQPRFSNYWDHAEARAVMCVDGPVLLVRGSLWDELGGFSEHTLMHGDDTDLCWEARERDLAVWFEADAEFIHLGDASAGRHWASPERSRLIGFAEGAIFRRHLPGVRGHVTLAVTVVALGSRALVFRAAGSRDRAVVHRERLLGYIDGFRSISAGRRDRAEGS